MGAGCHCGRIALFRNNFSTHVFINETGVERPKPDESQNAEQIACHCMPVDRYSQRLEATDDPSLRANLEHNANEEKEHAAMLLEWLRRNDPVLDEHCRTYFFSESEIHNIEENNRGRQRYRD